MADFTGDGGANVLTGGSDDDTLNGGGGADQMRGRAGNDLYFVENAGDRVIEVAGEGTDSIRTTITYTLPDHVENLALTGADAINGTGNALANVISGNAKPNQINGGVGADEMSGRNGHDVYVVDNIADVVVEQVDEGTDTIRSYVSYTLPDNVETLALGGAGIINATGNDLANRLYGNAKANVLDGGAGGDTMQGRAGHDTYIVDNVNDTAVEAADEGVDTVVSSVTYSLISNIENLYLSGWEAIDATGNAAGNRLIGNAAANKLDGARGADTMEGRLGDDTYIVDHVQDTVVELANEGMDRVRSLVSYTLPQHVEILILDGSAEINATGNTLANQLVGNRAKNLLDGGAGADVMQGGLGNDTYVVDDANDDVIELANEGADGVKSSISYTLGDNFEYLYLSGQEAINGTGNALANRIVGNRAANVLDGGGGVDSMVGGIGNDVFLVDQVGDQVIEADGEGTDKVISSVSFSLAGQFAERLTLSGAAAINGAGNTLANKIIGNGAANRLNGGGGQDELQGGEGNDSFEFTAAPGTANTARILDFQPAEDKILLGGAGGQPFAALASGALGAHAFRIGTAAADATDRIIYNSSTGALSYDADGAGGAAAAQFALLTPGLSLSAGDFLVTGAANRVPVFTSGTTASIAENSDVGTIVYQAAASDPDGDSFTYSLGGADAALFTIDASGAVRLIAPADYETRTSYSLTVAALDSGPSAATRNVAVAVGDVSDGTRIVWELSSRNGTIEDAEHFPRNFLSVANNANLPDDSLPSATIFGNVSSPSDIDFYRIDLKAGELLVLDVDQSGGSLDAVLSVYGLRSSTSPVAYNDDPGSLDPGSDPHPEYGHNTDPFIRFRAPEAGTYFFSIGSLQETGNSTFGSYALHVSVGPPATPAEIIEEDILAMLSGEKWPALSLTYGFPTRAGDYSAGEWTEEIAAGMEALDPTQQSAVRTVLIQAANFTNLSFSASSSAGSAALRYALSDLPESAYATFPGTGAGGDSWYNSSLYDEPLAGNYAWTGFLHETGHALGLKHTHESPAVSLGHDMLAYTVMSYRSAFNSTVDDDGGYTNEEWGFPQTYMMYDIAALQRLYGADFTTNSNNTTYTWSPTSGAFMINGAVQWTPGANRVFMTIWDGGGTDTYDLSNYDTNLHIDLRPGQWTRTADDQLVQLGDRDGFQAPGNVANALLYKGDARSLIEHAIGGSGWDWLVANQAANHLTGGEGRDRFVWNSIGDSRPGKADTIMDFERGADLIDLEMVDANTITTVDNMFQFIGTNAFSGASGELRYATEAGGLRLFGDVNGDKIADLEIFVAHQTTLSEVDFQF